ncbi:MAG: polysaccharide pyruvyl transferase family protein [Bacillota bacterium]|nr:polysaccharide pyruvyl transferase family protein [Bacillota bacterium]
MKIGILTHYNVNNQGAQLQVRATKNWLEDLGHETYILTYDKNFDFDPSEAKKNSGSFKNFFYYIKNYLCDKGIGLTLFNTRKVFCHKKAFQTMNTLPYDTDQVDCVVIGSDEVFSIDVGCNKMMYGHGLKKPAIAYAPAFGRSDEALLKEFQVYDLIQEGLNNMYALSARDTHTQSMIKNMTGRDVPLVCDPVLLYSGKNFIVPVKPLKKKYMLVYAYDRNLVDPKEIAVVKEYAKKHHLMTVSLGTYHKWCDKNVVCDALEWYSYFQNAACVLTDTFHGSVVAMKNHCQVAVFIRPSINAFKMKSLLEVTGLQEQELSEFSVEQLEKLMAQPIDYAQVDARIEKIAQESAYYLKSALEGVEHEY